jgi:hypothetical protein
LANVGLVDFAGRLQLGGDYAQAIGAPRNKPKRRAASRVLAGERLADPARGAGDEDLQRFAVPVGAGAAAVFSRRTVAIAASTAGIILSGPPAVSAVTRYFPFTMICGTASIL